MPARQSKVKVFVRTRPTENFANDMIEYAADSKVSSIERLPSRFFNI
jgi:hypothetical protein